MERNGGDATDIEEYKSAPHLSEIGTVECTVSVLEPKVSSGHEMTINKNASGKSRIPGEVNDEENKSNLSLETEGSLNDINSEERLILQAHSGLGHSTRFLPRQAAEYHEV